MRLRELLGTVVCLLQTVSALPHNTQENPEREHLASRSLNLTNSNRTRNHGITGEEGYAKGLNITNETNVRGSYVSTETKKANITDEAAVTLTVIEWLTQTPLPTAHVYVNQWGVILYTIIEKVSILGTSTSTTTTSSNRTSTRSFHLTSLITSSSQRANGTATPVSLVSAAKLSLGDMEDYIDPGVYSNPNTSTSSTSLSRSPPTSSYIKTTAIKTTTSSSSVVSSSAASAPVGIQSHISEGSGFGFTYGPVNPDGTCKVQSQVDEDISNVPNGFSLVRTYGVQCNQTAMVLAAAKKRGLRLFAGISNITTLDQDVATIAQAAEMNGGWDAFDTISIGNELVNFGADPAMVVNALLSAKSTLRNKYNYPDEKAIVTVDTLVAVRDHPELCDNSDYCAVNCHPFFDGGVTYEQAGWFLATQVATIRPLLKNPKQQIVVTETGWPAYGSPNGAAVPGPCNQVTAIDSIKTEFAATPAAVVILSAFNDMFKKDNSKTFGAEKYWGMYGNAPAGVQIPLPYNYLGCA